MVEIHPVVDCKGNPESLPLAVPRYPSGQCVGQDVIVGRVDVIQARHTKREPFGDALTITLSAKGRERLIQFTLNHVRNGIASAIDGRTVEAAIIREPIVSTTLEITGELLGAEIDALVEPQSSN